MSEKRTGWMVCMLIGAMAVYAVWNTAVVRHRLIQAEAYRVRLEAEVRELRQENDRLQREILQGEDDAVMERLARLRLGLVKPGEVIFCGTENDANERETVRSGG